MSTCQLFLGPIPGRSAPRGIRVNLFNPFLAWILALGCFATNLTLSFAQNQTELPDDTFEDVTVDSSGRFLAVGKGGTIVASYDGKDWIRFPTESTRTFDRVSDTHVGIIVAGDRGVIYRSTDGETFSEVRSGSTSRVRWSCVGVLSDGNRIVVPHSGGNFYHSQNGVDWSGGVIDDSAELKDAVWGNGTFVAVGMGNNAPARIYSSADGLNWQNNSASLGDVRWYRLTSVIFADGQFVAAGDDSALATSVDGINWTPLQRLGDGGSGDVTGLVYYDGKYYASSASELLISDDLDEWRTSDEQGVTVYAEIRKFAERDGVIIGVGGRVIKRDASGYWEMFNDSFTTPYDPDVSLPVIPRGQRLIQTGAIGDTTDLTVAAQGEGLTYQWYQGRQGDLTTPLEGQTAATLSVVYGEQSTPYWARVSNADTSVDTETFYADPLLPPTIEFTDRFAEAVVGQTVELSATVSGNPFPNVQWYRGVSGDVSDPVEGATENTLAVVTSVDGAEQYWLRADNGDTVTESETFTVVPWVVESDQPDFSKMAYGAGKFLATISRDPNPYLSSDGQSWEKQTDTELEGNFALDFHQGEFLLFAETVSFRSDGIQPWTEVLSDFDDDQDGAVLPVGERFSRLPYGVDRIAEGNGVYVASGRGVHVSSDGGAWSSVPEFENQPNQVFFGVDRFVVTFVNNASGSEFYTSSDGTTWDRQDAPDVPGMSRYDFFEFVGGRYYYGYQDALWVSSDLEKWQRIEGVSSPDVGVMAQGVGHFYHGEGIRSRRLWDGQSPRFLSFPEDVIAAAGTEVTLSPELGGDDLQLQWFLGEVGDTSSPIEDGNTASITVIATTQPKDYWLRIWGPTGSEFSPTVRVAPDGAPRILVPPAPPTLFGSNVQGVLRVKAAGAEPLSYQWYRGNTGDTSRPDGGSDTAEVPVFSTVRTERYWVRVSNSHGYADSVSVPVDAWAATPIHSSSGFRVRPAVAYGAGKFVIGGRTTSPSGDAVAISSSSHGWSTHGVDFAMGDMAFGAGLFAAIQSPSGSIFISTDGRSWSAVGGISDSFQWIRWEVDRFFAANQTGRLYHSADGQNWIQIDPYDSAWNGVAKVDGQYWGVLSDGRLVNSNDAQNWVSTDPPRGAAKLTNVIRLGSKLLLFDDQRRTYELGEGTWSVLPYRGPNGLKSVSTVTQVRNEAGRVVVGLPNTLGFTEDGISWWRTSRSGDSVAAGNGLLLAPDGSSVGFLSYNSPDPAPPMRRVFQPPRLNFDARTVVGTAGEPIELSVDAVGDGITIQWRRDGMNLEGATGSTLIIESASSSDAGQYDVVVSNGLGSVTSASAAVVINDAGLVPAAGVQSADRRRYSSGDMIRISNSVTSTASLDSLTWSLLLPDGWSITEGESDGGASVSISAGLVEWIWNAPPSSIDFDYQISVPEDPENALRLASMLTSAQAGVEVLSLAAPDPLILRAGGSLHSADVDADSRLSLSELLRVIELYNTRFGTSRTGRYRLNDQTADGFEPHVEGSTGPLGRYHSADMDSDGSLSLSELLRVIELYNTRQGTARTGAYRLAEGTADGFEPDS